MVVSTRISLGVSRAVCVVSWAISLCVIHKMLANMILLAGSREVVREEHMYESSRSRIRFCKARRNYLLLKEVL